MSDVTRCVLCGSARSKTLYSFDETDVVECVGCGLVYASRVPPPEELNVKYSKEYFEEFYGSGSETAAGAGAGVMKRLELRLPRKGKLLDVGCGAGDYLMAGLESGWAPVGVDVSRHAVEMARSRKLTVFEGTLESMRFDPDSFDAAISIHSIEHQTDPVAMLREIHRTLRPGGILFVSTPNIGGASAIREGKEWNGLRIGQHFFFFTRGTLQRAAEKAGFRILDIESQPSIVSGTTVDRALGKRLGAPLRRIARLLFGNLIDRARNAAAAHSEGDAIVLTAMKPL
jgi:2-polyprenyl-3-methyl-5-hydroxy-6-metoxy-1,4-benzoquinol methylase